MIRRVVSGGQTGADRAALDVAQALGIETGGWVPRNRWAEDGRIPGRYPDMKETSSADPAVRTECNVRDSDGTVVFSHGPVAGGTKWTVKAAGKLRRPVLHLDLATQPVDAAARRLRAWTVAEDIAVLNVAGPRASEDRDIYAAVRSVLESAFGETPEVSDQRDGPTRPT